MKTVVIIQARMTSTRLPGKVLKTVLDKPLLTYQLERLRRLTLADEVVVATTVNDTDQPIVDLCASLGVPVFRGSEDDVLSRYYGAAKEHHADVVVRLTSDCPLIDPLVVDAIIREYLDHRADYDYVSNIFERTYPRGLDTEVFSFQALEEAFHEGHDPAEREHVTPFIYRNPQRYRLKHYLYPSDNSQYRWTVDTPEDFELIKRMLEALVPDKPDFTLEDCLQLLAEHPEWAEINAHIEQKKLGQ